MSTNMTLVSKPTLKVEHRESGIWLIIDEGYDQHIAIALRDADDSPPCARPTLVAFLQPAMDWMALHPQLAAGEREA